MTKNGEPMEYKLGTELLEPGVYTVKMVDSLGNTKELTQDLLICVIFYP